MQTPARHPPAGGGIRMSGTAKTNATAAALAAAGQELAAQVRVEAARGATSPDYFSTRKTSELQDVLRRTPTLGIENLINTGKVHVDFEQQRIYRDVFWKGSFAEDSLLGREERLRNKVLGKPEREASQPFTGGSFWKRFDRVENGVAYGYVVNYEMSALPGRPEVRTTEYPDARRSYFTKADKILLLNYTNHPYKLVYDTIKIIDEQNAIGVMHLGTFPSGVEFSTFVMARHNYPFAHMSIPDHEMLFADPRASVASPGQLKGRWEGHLIFVTKPEVTLSNQLSPALFQIEFEAQDGRTSAACRTGSTEFTRIADGPAIAREMRMLGPDTVLGRWSREVLEQCKPGLLAHFLQGKSDHAVHFVLRRAPR
jgi:hypothetical protein